MKLIAKENNIIVELLSDAKMMKRKNSPIYMPERRDEPNVPQSGIVRKVGPGPTGVDGKPSRPCIVQPGEKVFFPRDVGNHIMAPNGDFVIMPDHCVLCAFEDDEEPIPEDSGASS